jgi:hypothetical protein
MPKPDEYAFSISGAIVLSHLYTAKTFSYLEPTTENHFFSWVS